MTISGKIMHVSSSAEEIAGNEDLLTEILLRLPVKSLLRFESVTKKWLSLISHPHFSQNYSRLHNPNYQPSGLLLNHYSLNYSRLHNPNCEPFRLLWDNYCADFQFLPFNGDGDGDRARVRHSHPDDPGIMIFQSCNGLLLCSSLIYSYPKFEYYICNPTTKQFATISFPIPNLAYNEFDVNLAFDPLKSPYYKLLCIRKLDEETRASQIDIYSSETGSWRPPISGDPLIFTAPQGIALTAPVYWRGALHWYSDEQTSLYFNTDTECLKTMPMPPFEDDCFDFSGVRYFGESRGHLHITMIPQPSATEFDIWELETDYSGWFIRYRVNLDAVMIAFPLDATEIRHELTNAFSILWVDRAEKEEESTLVLFVSGKAISFNLHKNTSKKLCDLVPCQKPVPLSLDYEWNGAYQYIETLFHV